MKIGKFAGAGPETEALLQGGVAHHVAGRLAEAERAYREVLRRQPAHARALHLLGLIAFQSGEAARAVELFDRAIAIRPDFPEAHDNRGTALYALDRFEAAAASYDRAIALKPGQPGAHANRGNALQALGRGPEALADYDAAIALKPDFAEAWYGRGAALSVLKRYGEALTSHARAISLNPGYAKAFEGRAVALHGLRRLPEALASYDQAVALNPAFAEAWFGRGVALAAWDKHKDAVISHDRAIALKPDFAEAFNNRAVSLMQLGQPEAALASLDEAVLLKPAFAAAQTHRGNALQALGRMEEALRAHDAAIAAQDDYAEAWSNRAHVLADLGRHEEAVADCGRAAAINPDFGIARFNLGMGLLRLGRFEEGWPEYEQRGRAQPALAPRPYPQPLWTGQEVRDRTVFVYHEQGLGDAIQFSRYAAMLAERGAEVVLAAPAALHGVLATLEPRVTVIGERERPRDFDFHCPAPSLPLGFGTVLDSIPAPARYLMADEAAKTRWAEVLGEIVRPRIGLAWSGNRTHKNDANRSIPFERFGGLMSDAADWVSLQKELRPQDAEAVLGGGVRHFGEALKTFSDTAALIEAMDLVVTVDTSVAHLAGALGKPVWILLPFNPDWRWLLKRNDSPWYPSARLFRQPAPGDWDAVLEDVRRALPGFLEGLRR